MEFLGKEPRFIIKPDVIGGISRQVVQTVSADLNIPASNQLTHVVQTAIVMRIAINFNFCNRPCLRINQQPDDFVVHIKTSLSVS
jgi:hypothetical protein